MDVRQKVQYVLLHGERVCKVKTKCKVCKEYLGTFSFLYPTISPGLESELHRLSLFPRTTPLKAGDEEAEAQVSPWAAADAPGRVLLGKPHVRQPATLPGRQRGGQSPPRRGGEGGGDDGLILLGVYTARRVDDAHDSAEGESVA